ncbi:flagellar biosynthetic protein FliO [Metabacillus mangrovi]|nr:flagellar biosynthetic protein FliO [Metabacillus mangrovi]
MIIGISILLILAAVLLPSSPVAASSSGGTVEDYLKQEPKADPAEKEDTPASESRPPGVTAWDVIKMIFATIFVAGLIYFIFRVLSAKNRVIRPAVYLQTLGGTPLGQNRSIQLVKAGDVIMVVGVGDSVQLLKTIDDREEIDKITRQYADKGADFEGARKFLAKTASAIAAKQGEEKSASFKKTLQKQLDEMKAERRQKEEEWLKKGNKQ